MINKPADLAEVMTKTILMTIAVDSDNPIYPAAREQNEPQKTDPLVRQK